MIALYAAPSGLLPFASARIERYAAVGNAYSPTSNKYSYAYLTTFFRKNQPVPSKTLNHANGALIYSIPSIKI